MEDGILIVKAPADFTIHGDFLQELSIEEFKKAFKRTWDIFAAIYGEIIKSPAKFGMSDKGIPERMFSLLHFLFVAGTVKNKVLNADVSKFNELSTDKSNIGGSDWQVKNANLLFERLCDYGFEFEGLKGFKIPKSADFVGINYPDNPNVITILKFMADKAYKFDRRIDFFSCHYRLFADDKNTINYGFGPEIIADRVLDPEEQEFIYAMDKALREKGYFAQTKGGYEKYRYDYIGRGRKGYAYYDKKSTMNSKYKEGAYHFWMKLQDLKLILYMRIEAEKCLDYVLECPESVKDIFRGSDDGCNSRIRNTCKHKQEYEFEGEAHWKCGCCHAVFHCVPKIEDIPYYIKLVEMSAK